MLSSASGCVLLKRLSAALDDGDNVLAVVLGSAINNDGRAKVGYLAPSVDGQSAVISEALAVAGVDAGDVTYVEAHGTGTLIGDPIEIAALTKAYRHDTSDTAVLRDRLAEDQHRARRGGERCRRVHQDGARPASTGQSPPVCTSSRRTRRPICRTHRSSSTPSCGRGSPGSEWATHRRHHQPRCRWHQRPPAPRRGTACAPADAAARAGRAAGRRVRTVRRGARPGGGRARSPPARKPTTCRWPTSPTPGSPVASSSRPGAPSWRSTAEDAADGARRRSTPGHVRQHRRGPTPSVAFLDPGRWRSVRRDGPRSLRPEPVYRRVIDECADLSDGGGTSISSARCTRRARSTDAAAASAGAAVDRPAGAVLHGDGDGRAARSRGACSRTR